MSPRAAWRLEGLGFGSVYDYVAGKVDWMAAGLKTFGADPSERLAIDAVDAAAPTCTPETPWFELPDSSAVIVVNAERIVLGRVPGDRPDEPGKSLKR
jgi:hypothetical protein